MKNSPSLKSFFGRNIGESYGYVVSNTSFSTRPLKPNSFQPKIDASEHNPFLLKIPGIFDILLVSGKVNLHQKINT